MLGSHPDDKAGGRADPRLVRSPLGILVSATLLLAALAAPPTSAYAARPPVLSAHGATVGEAPGAVALVRVTLARRHGPVTVRWRTQDGTARAGSDYVAARGTLRFGKKQRTRWVRVALVDDAASEPGETFEVVLHRANGARIRGATATVSIGPSDARPPVDPVLTVARTGPGAGYVRTDPEIDGLDHCNLGTIAGCSAPVGRGTAVSVWVEPDGSSTFDGWATPGCTGTDPCHVVVTRDTTLTATFSALPGTFTARAVGPGHLSITDALDDGCNETSTYCVGQIAYGAGDATVTVVKDDPADVVVWTGDVPCAQGVLSCTIRAGRELVATIVAPVQTVTVTATGSGSGTVTGPGISCTATATTVTGDCTEAYATGSSVTLSATPGAGSQILHFSLPPCAISGVGAGTWSCTSTITSPQTSIARFEPV